MNYMVFDSHCDTPFSLWRKKQRMDQTDCHVSLQRAEQFPGYAQFFAFCTLAGWQGGYSCEELLQLPYAFFLKQIEVFSDRITHCTNYEQMNLALENGKIAAFFSLEGAEGINCDPGRLEELARLGIRMINLTWNEDNALAGCSKHDGPGLSAQGRDFVRRAQKLGMMIDVSHISDRAFWDVLETAEKPVVASHSNSRAICSHTRNLTDDQFRGLCQHGGYTGINLFSAFLSDDGSADFETVYRHIDHFLQISGGGHVALGGDLDGCDQLPDGFSGLHDYEKLASFLEYKGFGSDAINDIYSNTMKRIVRLCTI